MALNPLELIYLLVLIIVPALVLYFVIRLGVRHGVMDANRRLSLDPPMGRVVVG